MSKLFTAESDLVAAFCEIVAADKRNPWVAYHETAGWDLLLAHPVTALQIGIEAKLSLNPKVLDQALPDEHWYSLNGPDYRAVLVPADSCQLHMERMADRCGVHVIKIRARRGWDDSFTGWGLDRDLPDQASGYRDWHPWCPEQRCVLPDYIPDVTGGHAAPLQLTPWKIKAIKLMIILERRGFVTRSDMKALQISPSRWCDKYGGFLTPGDGGYYPCERTPDLKAQHPRNWAEIEADLPKWGAPFALPATPYPAAASHLPVDLRVTA
jgi:hypothetical protein